MTAHVALDYILNSAPRHWERRRFRFATRLRTEKNALSDQPLLSVSAAHGVRERDEGGLGRQAPAEETIPTYWVVRPGDIVVNPMWVIEGGVAASAITGAVSPAYRVYVPEAGVEPRYLHHLLRSRPYIEQYKQYVRGVTTFDRAVSKEDFSELPILLPPPEEQRRIADFLDAEISRIDQLANLQRKVLVRLEERDTAILDTELDRLADEIGTLPFRRYVVGVDQGSSPQCEAIPATAQEWGVLKVSCLRPGKFFPDENKRLPEDLVPNSRHEVQQGDLLITRANTPQLVGATAVVPRIRGKLLLSDKIFRVRTRPTLDPDYLAAVARGSRVRNLCSAASNGASQSMANIRFEEVKEWPIPAVSLDGQRDLVSRMTRVWDVTRDLRVRVQSQLSLLADRKQALITAAVTGQIDVSTASGRGIED